MMAILTPVVCDELRYLADHYIRGTKFCRSWLARNTRIQLKPTFSTGRSTLRAREVRFYGRIRVITPKCISPKVNSGAGLPLQAFNTSVVAMPAASKFGRGNSTKDAFRGPGINNWDMSLMKNFRWHEGTRNVQFRFETYNSFNHTQFGGATGTGTSVDTVARFDAAGRQVNTRFGQYLASRDGRRVQLGLKFSF